MPLPYAIPAALAAVVSAVLAAYVWRHRKSALARPFLLTLASLTVWSVTAALEIIATTDEARLFWSKVGFLGIPFVPVFWLIFVLDYGRPEGAQPRSYRGFLFVPAVLTTVLAWTNEMHGLIWTDVRRAADGLLVFEHGLYFWIGTAGYSWALVAVGSVLLLRRFLASSSVYRAQAGMLLAAGTFPLVLNMLYVAGLGPIEGLDVTPLGFAIGCGLITWALFTYRLLDIGPVAYEAVFKALGDSVIVLDPEGRITEINPPALRGTGKLRHEVIGRPAREVYSHRPELLERLKGSRDVHTEATLDEGEGYQRRVEIRIFPILARGGEETGRVIMARDITERLVYQRRIEEMAFRDFLTGLPNRRALHDLAGKALALARRRQWGVAVLFLDLDDFKNVNDAHGHAAGDLALQLVASRLQSTVRGEDTLVRLGGDEFALLMQDCTAESAGRAGMRLLEVLREPFEVRDTMISMEASVGIALFPQAGGDVEDLIAQADVAMYQAKHSPQSVAFYDHTQDLFTQELLKLETEFRHALRAEEIFLDYQPILDLRSGELAGLEALARWQHPERGLLQPFEFLPHLEERSLTWTLDRYVLKRALSELGQLPYPVSVNFSTRSLLDSELHALVEKALQEFDVEPHRLTLEVSEMAISANEEPAKTVERLQGLGVKVAADDFGAGYSSLSHLRDFPYSLLKLDQFVVSGIGRSREDEGILQAILTVAKSLHRAVIAEGVETREQLEWLRRHGCDFAQGFLIAEPLSLAEVRRAHMASASLLSPELDVVGHD